MHLVEVSTYPAAPDADEVVAFIDRVTAVTGERPLSDHLWLDLRRGGSAGFVAVRIADDTATVAYAQISAANDESALEVAVAPGGSATPLARDAAETAIDHFAAAGGGALTVWVDDDPVGAAIADVSTERGLELRRTLHEMRVTLPLEQHATVVTRPFRPGADDAAWLAVNNRAFAAHGEQGGWTLDTLALRLAEPWFDADGFRVHEVDGRLAAFCWTKIHGLDQPVSERHGEIYVIAVDPDFHGRGLGRQLTLAGLDAITDRGLTTANLYVDGDNEAALTLYRSLGFTVHRTRRAFGGSVEPTHEEHT